MRPSAPTTMTPVEATYLAWLDFSDTPLAADPAEPLLEIGRISAHGGGKFEPSAAAFLRLNFATSREILDMIIDRIAHTLEVSS